MTLAACEFLERLLYTEDELEDLEREAGYRAVEKIQAACTPAHLEPHSGVDLSWLVGLGTAGLLRSEARGKVIFLMKTRDLVKLQGSIRETQTLNTQSLTMGKLSLSDGSLLEVEATSTRVNSFPPTLHTRDDGVLTELGHQNQNFQEGEE